MKYAELGQGSHSDDDSLEAIEDHEHGFGLPGQSAVGHVGGVRLADIGNQDENSTGITAPTGHHKIKLTEEPGIVSNEGLSSVSPGSLSPLINGALGSNMNARIAYIMENGEPFCNHCERNFVPSNFTRIACTNCGCGQPNEDHGNLDHLFENGNAHVANVDLEHVEGPTVADEVRGKEIVKQESRYSFVDMALESFQKKSNDSELYYRGYNDAHAGKPLDEDLAILSDDYFHGYDQHKFYNKTPLQSTGHDPHGTHDLQHNTQPIGAHHEMRPMDYDRGPLELTDGFGHVTASKTASMYDAAHMFMDRKDYHKDDANQYHKMMGEHHSQAASRLQGATPWTGRTNPDGSPEFHAPGTFYGSNPDHREAYFAHMDAAEAHGKAIATLGTGMNYDQAKKNADVASQAAWAKDPTNAPAVPRVTRGVDNHALLQTLNEIDPEMAKHYSDILGISLDDNSSASEERNASRKLSSIFPTDVIQKFFEV